jgi:hypothetical protein
MKVVRLSALRYGRLYCPGNIPGTHLYQRLSQPQDHNAAGRIMSMKNYSNTIGNRTRDLPACGVVPQPTVPPRAPLLTGYPYPLLLLLLLLLLLSTMLTRKVRSTCSCGLHCSKLLRNICNDLPD